MLSVILPTLEEATRLPATLEALARNSCQYEVIVVDAASQDGTAEVAQGWGARVIVSDRRQRAHQLNLGAAAARGEALLFLHADTVMPTGSLDRVEKALWNQRVVGGGFARRFRSRSPLLAVTSRLADLRGRWAGVFLGDQAMFARARTFRELGGFRETARCEDLDLSLRLCRHGRVVLLTPAVLSSARRFERRGALRTTVSDLAVALREWRTFRP